MEREYPQRAPWHAFPDVVICARESDVKHHADYEQAKEGNLQDSAPAAKRLSSAMVTSEAIAMLRLFDGAVDHGPEIENWRLEDFGYDFSCLTESEARYLVRVENADTIRSRISEARSDRDH